MEQNKPRNPEVSKQKITTIKLTEHTKSRLDHLKLYSRETYEEIMVRFLEILNVARQSPERARMQLIKLDKERKRNLGISAKPEYKPRQDNIKSERQMQRKE